jgi:hypothetical protein
LAVVILGEFLEVENDLVENLLAGVMQAGKYGSQEARDT